MTFRRTDQVNQKIKAIHRAIPIQDIWEIPGIHEILAHHPKKSAIRGYIARLSMKEIGLSVPNGRQFKDRDGNDYQGGPFDAPLLTLAEWRSAYLKKQAPAPDLLINANFFNTWDSGLYEVGNRLDLRHSPRTFLAGLSMDHGTVVSSEQQPSHGRHSLDTILFDEKHQVAKLVLHKNIKKILEKAERANTPYSAVSGFASFFRQKRRNVPPSIKNFSRVARTGIGILPNQRDFLIMVIENLEEAGVGLTIKQFTRLMRVAGCQHVLNLDGGGSSELLYEGTNEWGQPVKLHTKSSDRENIQRPKPNFIGFRITSKPRQYAYDDSDISPQKIPSRYPGSMMA